MQAHRFFRHKQGKLGKLAARLSAAGSAGTVGRPRQEPKCQGICRPGQAYSKVLKTRSLPLAAVACSSTEARERAYVSWRAGALWAQVEAAPSARQASCGDAPGPCTPLAISSRQVCAWALLPVQHQNVSPILALLNHPCIRADIEFGLIIVRLRRESRLLPPGANELAVHEGGETRDKDAGQQAVARGALVAGLISPVGWVTAQPGKQTTAFRG